MFGNVTILDSAGQAFFARQLEHIKAKSYDVEYADLVARQMIPVSNEAPEGAATITYRTYDRVGAAKIINAYADDLPRVDVFGKETTSPVRAIAASFGYNRDEILQAQMTGISLDQRRANAVQRAWEEVVDSVAWNGDDTHGLIGFLNHPNVPSKASITASGWLNATPDEIIADFNQAVAQVRTVTKKKERVNTVLVPVSVYNHLSGTPRAAMSDTTILQFILQNVEGINQIESVNELETDAIFYDKNPDKLTMEIVKELEFLPPQERGLELLVPAWGKTGGVIVYYPMSILKLTDVA